MVEGCFYSGDLSTNGTYGMKKEVNHDNDDQNKIQVNGTKNIITEEFPNIDSTLVTEEISDHSSEEAVQENGAITNHPSNGHTEIGIARSEIQIDEDARVELMKSPEEVAEVDLKKVLDEQETHDLYCPNCNSCITKRVILRKRKRTIEGTHYDTPPAKLTQRQPPIDSADELTEPDLDPEPYVFRCCACFSFFIPTASGIYRIFQRRGETVSQPSSVPSPASIGNISSPVSKQPGIRNTSESGSIFSIFQFLRIRETKTVISAQPKEVTEGSSSSPLPRTDQESKSGLLLPSGSTDSTPHQMTGQIMDLQTSPGDKFAHMFGKDFFEEKKSPEDATVSVAGSSEGQSTIGEKDAVSQESYNTDGKQVHDPQSSMQDYLDKMKSEGLNLAKSQIMTDDMSGTMNFVQTTSKETTSHQIIGSEQPATTVSTRVETRVYIGEQSAGVAGRRNDWDVLKSIVYGGLMESVASLCVVSSAAGSDASTLNIVALGLANLIGGLFVIAHDLSDLITNREKETKKNGVPVGRYWELLGMKANYRIHAFIAVLTYILVGLLPPVVYGFTFRKSDNKEYKLVAVAAASLVCIFFLAIGKAHVSANRTYFKTLSYYIALGFGASGLSYVAGVMIDRLLVQLGVFENTSVAPVPPSSMFNVLASTQGVWASS